MKTLPSRRGYVVLLSVIVVALIGAIISITLLIGGVNSARDARTIENAVKARAAAESCGDLAIAQLLLSVTFVGSAAANVGLGSCTYTVASVSLLSSTITATGTVGASVQKLQSTVTILPVLSIGSWQVIP